MNEKYLLTPAQAAERLGLAVATLMRWRWAKRGPKYIKLSRRAVRYDPADLESWLEARRGRAGDAQVQDAP